MSSNECAQKGQVEFVGPVKIVLVDRSNSKEYLRAVWYAALVSVAEMLLATATTIAQFYAMEYTKTSFVKGLHVLCGTIGLQACLLSGILTMNSASGAAAPVKISARTSEHICVQFCALIFGVVSAVCAFLTSKSITSLHSTLGFVATGLVILAGLSGLFLLEGGVPPSEDDDSMGVCLSVHLVTGTLACIVSAMCFVSGLTSDTFLKWLPADNMYRYMVLCCVVYTTIILYKPMMWIIMGRRDS